MNQASSSRSNSGMDDSSSSSCSFESSSSSSGGAAASVKLALPLKPSSSGSNLSRPASATSENEDDHEAVQQLPRATSKKKREISSKYATLSKFSESVIDIEPSSPQDITPSSHSHYRDETEPVEMISTAMRKRPDTLGINGGGGGRFPGHSVIERDLGD